MQHAAVPVAVPSTLGLARAAAEEEGDQVAVEEDSILMISYRTGAEVLPAEAVVVD